MPLRVFAIVPAVGLHILLVVRALRAVPLSVLGVVHELLVVTALQNQIGDQTTLCRNDG